MTVPDAAFIAALGGVGTLAGWLIKNIANAFLVQVNSAQLQAERISKAMIDLSEKTTAALVQQAAATRDQAEAARQTAEAIAQQVKSSQEQAEVIRAHSHQNHVDHRAMCEALERLSNKES
jgi:hypothetical protein